MTKNHNFIAENNILLHNCDLSNKGKVVEYIESKYGSKAAPISINSLIRVKAAIRDVERMHKGEVTLETEIMCRNLPNMPQGVDGEKWLNGYQDKELGTWVPGFLEDKSPAAVALKKYSQDNPEIWAETVRCLGIMRQKSKHACFVGDTLIDDNGKVSWLQDAKYTVKDAITVWSTGERETIRLRMNSGVSIQCTPDHVFFTEDGREIEAQNLTQNDILVFTPFSNASGSVSRDLDDCFWAGWMLNDGTPITGNMSARIYFTPIKDDEAKNRFFSTYGEFASQKGRIDRYCLSRSVNDRVSNGEVRPIHKRRLPKDFWSLTHECQSQFISGLFSANGHVLSGRVTRVGMHLASPDLISDVVLWLSANGISTSAVYGSPQKFTIRGKEYINHGSVHLAINMLGNSGERAFQLIKFLQSYKQQAFEQAYAKTRPSNKYVKKEPKKLLHRVLSIVPGVRSEVFDFNEPITNKGFVSGYLVHNCGIVLASGNLQDLVPMTVVGEDLVTGFCPKSCEYVGLVKFDILGVSTLESLRISMKEIEKAGLEKFKWGEFPATHEDYEKVIKPMHTAGIFQIKTNTMRPFTHSLQPRSTLDLSNQVALVRPGAMDAPSPDGDEGKTAADYFVQVRQGRKSPVYIHPDLEPIIGETYGILLYQEQALQVFRDLGGYSYGEAEAVRRAIGKKIKDLMELHLGVLKTRVVERGWEIEQAEQLCEAILASARYSFNKSHSASYGIVANNGIYLKARYPLYFYLGELTINSDDREKVQDLISECPDLILQPSIFKSHPSEWRIEDGKLRAPLTVIKGVGSKSASSLIALLEKGLDSYTMKPVKIKAPSKRVSKKKELSL